MLAFGLAIQYIDVTNMRSSGSRAFGSTTKGALRWVGATKNDILIQNPGEKGKQALPVIENIEAAAERKVRLSCVLHNCDTVDAA